MIDHLKLYASDVDRSVALYEQALAPLGFTRQLEFGGSVAFGRERPELWIAPAGDEAPTRCHVALRADDQESVQAFHAAALAAGASDNGAPGPRPHYHPTYYGAFVLDFDGNNLEAVNHG